MDINNVMALVRKEVEAATVKHPTWPTDALHAVAVVGEESGELTQAVLQATYEPDKQDLGSVQIEAVHTAAMAIRFLMSIDQYTYTKSYQHTQQSEVERERRNDY